MQEKKWAFFSENTIYKLKGFT